MIAPLQTPAQEIMSPRPRLALRDYQRECIDAAYAWHGTHEGHCLLIVPTGGGKSLIMGTLAKEAVDGGARVLIIAHRKELIEQNWKALQHAGMRAFDCGIISGQHKRKDRTTPATVASIQTLARSPYTYGPYDLILVDEAHLVPKNEDTAYRKYLDAARTQRPTMRVIGLTATAYRLDSGRLDEGEKRVFDDVAYEITIQQLLDAGYLAPLISKATLARYDVSGVATRGGEYVETALQAAVDDPATTTAVIAELSTLAADRRRWLVFCAGVAHAEHMADALTAAGYPAAAVHGELSLHERAARLAGLRNGTLRALTNCDVLTTGYDEPSIDLLALCRPTASTGLHVQMLGRGFRTAPGKTDCLVLDFAGNCMRHGPVDAVRIRDPKKKREDATGPAKECPTCQSIVGTATRLCPQCAHEFPPPAPAQLAPTAMLSPVMSKEKAPAQWFDITSWSAERHIPRDRLKRDTLRVDYFFHFQKVASEWVCIEHDGYAREKAEQFWGMHGDMPCPDTIDEAAALFEQLECPTAVAVEPEGKYQRIANRRFHDVAMLPERPAPRDTGSLPRACWSCTHFDPAIKHCGQYDASPPDDVQRIGCESWTDEEDIATLLHLDDLPF